MMLIYIMTPEQLFITGVWFYKIYEDNQAYGYFKEAAEQGHYEARMQLAHYYYCEYKDEKKKKVDFDINFMLFMHYAYNRPLNIPLIQNASIGK